MSDSIVRLRVDSAEYDQKLKRATEGLNRYVDGCRKAGGTLEHVDDGVKEFTQQLGKMETVATGAKGKLGEMTKAFTDLKMQFNQMSEAEKQSQFGKALSASLDQLKTRIIDTKNQLANIQDTLNEGSGIGNAGGGLFGGDKLSGMLQVFGGNMMTKAAGMAAGFAAELGDAVKQGVELARQGEGIRMAFERLGRGDILQGLREATHGTVTDLELMKAAVKFNDFKLPLEELGTMLAFAQQKAKDTGQNVDYMVDSIVTGLGRKSLMILDNLGLSAAEIKEKMKENGDMTKAVGAIIREQMAKAGDYIETAADRATKADVDLKNAMEDLGRTFQPLTDAGTSMWNSLKIGALDLLNNAVKPLIQALSEAGALGQNARAGAGFNNLGGNSKVDRMIGRLGNGKTQGAYSIYQQQLGEFDKYINSKRFQIAAYGNDKSGIAQSNLQRLQTELDGALKMRAEYVKRAQELHNQVPSPYEPSNTKTGGGGNRGGGSTQNVINYASDSIAAQQAIVSELTKEWQNAGADVRDGYLVQLIAAENALKRMKNEAAMVRENMAGKLKGGEVQTNLGTLTDYRSIEFKGLNLNSSETQKGVDDLTKSLKEQQKAFGLASQAATSFGAALAGIEDPGVKAAGMVMQAVASIALGFAQASASKTTAGTGWGWLAWLAAGASAMATTIATIHSLTGYAEGGIVKGNSYSGDNLYGPGFGINAGELVLNTAQQNNVAQALEGGGLKNLKLEGVLKGENIWIAANRYTKRTGQGEIVTW